MKIRAGTRGRISNVDGSAAAALYDGALARVVSRIGPTYGLIELLDDGPHWKRGTKGALALRYFIPNPPRSPKPR